jgi:hypothetical protein
MPCSRRWEKSRRKIPRGAPSGPPLHLETRIAGGQVRQRVIVRLLLPRRQPIFEPICIAAAGPMFGTICQPYEILAIVDRLKFANTSNAYNLGAMNTKELRRVEFLFQGIQSLPQKVTTSGTVQFSVVSRPLNPFDVFCRHKQDSRPDADRKT